VAVDAWYTRRRGRRRVLRWVPAVEPVSHEERVAAARARVVADRKRGVDTADWIRELASEGRTDR
jgi:hypothetical protein